MPELWLDLGGLSCACTDHALEFAYKALADPVDNGALWQPHPDPLLRATIESVSRAGTHALREAFSVLREVARGLDEVRKAFTPSRADAIAAAIRVSAKAPSRYDVNDWLALVDWIMVRYLPPDFFASQAEYLTARAAAAGKIAAVTDQPVDTTRLPTTLEALLGVAELTPVQEEMLNIANARAAIALTQVGEDTRHRVKRIVVSHLERRVVGDKTATGKALERELFDEFGVLNRDWRRVAITEAGNARNEAQVAATPIGGQVKRFEAYEGACAFCAKINGMIFTVVDPAKPDKDGWKEVWVGKTNYGRSASPRRREGDVLIPREPHELWWPAAGVQHPNCRGGWVPVFGAGRDPKTVDFVNKLLARHGVRPAIQPTTGA